MGGMHMQVSGRELCGVAPWHVDAVMLDDYAWREVRHCGTHLKDYLHGDSWVVTFEEMVDGRLRRYELPMSRVIAVRRMTDEAIATQDAERRAYMERLRHGEAPRT